MTSRLGLIVILSDCEPKYCQKFVIASEAWRSRGTAPKSEFKPLDCHGFASQ